MLADRNSHDQGVLSGGSREMEKALKACRKNKIRGVKLPVASAFHTPFVEKAAAPFKERIEAVEIKNANCLLFSNIPFIAMTGHGDEKIAVEMMKLGARDYLIKGFDMTDILPAVFKRIFNELEIVNNMPVLRPVILSCWP